MRLIVICLTVLFVQVGSQEPSGPKVVNHSFARTDEAVMTHLDINLFVDFDSEKLKGYVNVEFDNKTGTDKLYLDSRNLNILRVVLTLEKRETTFTLGETVAYLGEPLIIDIEPTTRQVTVFYETILAHVFHELVTYCLRCPIQPATT